MNRYQALTFNALFIILTGAILILLSYKPSRAIQYSVVIGMLMSAVFSYVASYKSKNAEIPLKYHELHALGMVVYSIAIVFYANSTQKFIDVTTFYLLYYGFSEIIFCFQLLILKVKVILPTVVVRMVTGLVIALGALIMLGTSYNNQNKALLGYGSLFIISGIALFFFKTVLKKMDKPPMV